jgi:hypothetical protein
VRYRSFGDLFSLRRLLIVHTTSIEPLCVSKVSNRRQPRL